MVFIFSNLFGDLVFTFSTTVAPLVQSELVPLFVDVEINTLQIDTSILENIPLDNVSAICVPNLIGNIANWEEIYNFARANNLKIIEDSADTIGYQYETNLIRHAIHYRSDDIDQTPHAMTQ